MIDRRFKFALAPLAAFLILCLTVGAQVSQVEKVDLEVMKKIREEGMNRSQVMDTLSWLTDVIGYRLTGSPGMKAANEWTKKKLAEWGLENAHLEAWGEFGRGWSFDKISAQVVEPTPFPVIAYPEAWTPGTNGPVTAEVIFADIKSEADLEKYKGKLKGKFVMTDPAREVKALFQPPAVRLSDEELLKMANDEPAREFGRISPEQANARRQRAQLIQKISAFLKDEGALAVIKLSRAGVDGGTVFVQGGGSREKNAPPVLPSVVLAAEHYNRISRIMQKGIAVKMELNVSAKFHDEDLNAYNTIAEIPGGDKKDELVMLGGHMDSWHGGTGATDNAAGVAVAMEAVRILKALGVNPRRTIRIALWSGEEEGLLGSRGYVAAHFGDAQPRQQEQGGQPGLAPGFGPAGPIVTKPDHSKFSAYFNLDNGTGRVRGVYLQGNEAVRQIFRAWLAPFNDLGASTLTIRNTSGTDHLSFDRVGLPGFQFIQDPIDYDTRTHHSNQDVYDRIQADDMKQAAVIMAAFVYNAAMREEKLPRKPMPSSQQAAR
ncbi:MAG: M20/M25/M40 family metallo-hydrolase [Blastocatellia bacterium]|nr:M20/M25/M40 family metallo-hydrolase [Blastocatellia bacterium]